MPYEALVTLHLSMVLPAFAIGTFQLVRRKGTPTHRLMGRVYLVLMALTGVTTLFMPAEVGPRFQGHFGWIHSFSLLTLYTVPMSYVAARRGQVARHRGGMIGLYVGGILVAGSLAFVPGRMLNRWLMELLR